MTCAVVTKQLPTLEDIRNTIGDTLTEKLLTSFSGTSVRFPVRKSGVSFAALSDVIGPQAASELCDEFGGAVFYFARETASLREKRNLEIRSRVLAGERLSSLAQAYETTEMTIRRIIKASR